MMGKQKRNLERESWEVQKENCRVNKIYTVVVAGTLLVAVMAFFFGNAALRGPQPSETTQTKDAETLPRNVTTTMNLEEEPGHKFGDVSGGAIVVGSGATSIFQGDQNTINVIPTPEPEKLPRPVVNIYKDRFCYRKKSSEIKRQAEFLLRSSLSLTRHSEIVH